MMNKIKLVGQVVIHLVALVVVSVASRVLKGSRTNLGNQVEPEVLHSVIYLTSSKSSSVGHKQATDREEAHRERVPEVRI